VTLHYEKLSANVEEALGQQQPARAKRHTNKQMSMDLKRPLSPSTVDSERPSKMVVAAAGDTTDASNSSLLVKRVSERGRLPTRGSPLAAGYDLYSAEDKIVPANGKALIDTQVSIAVPVGTYGRVAPRSGLASKFMIATGAGVIDADYRGILFVLLFNHSDKDFEVKEGDRVAQLIIERCEHPDVIEVESLQDTSRGAGGFGSTGGHVAL